MLLDLDRMDSLQCILRHAIEQIRLLLSTKAEKVLDDETSFEPQNKSLTIQGDHQSLRKKCRSPEPVVNASRSYATPASWFAFAVSNNPQRSIITCGVEKPSTICFSPIILTCLFWEVPKSTKAIPRIGTILEYCFNIFFTSDRRGMTFNSFRQGDHILDSSICFFLNA